MFGRRDFLEDSSSSFDGEQPGTPPPYFQQERLVDAHLENEFEFEDKSEKRSQDYFTSPADNSRGLPITAPDSSGASFQPLKKEKNDKIYFMNPVDQTPEEVPDRPTTSVRPGSSSAQMRAKMLEAKKNNLMSRPGGNVVVQSSNPLLSSKAEAAPLDNVLYSSTVYNEKDISGSKALKAFNIGGVAFEPGVRNQNDMVLGPIKAEVTIIKSDDIEEVKLEEGSAIRNVPSKGLQEMHKKMEENQRHNAPIVPPPMPTEVIQARPERFSIPEVAKAPRLEEPPRAPMPMPVPVVAAREEVQRPTERPKEEVNRGGAPEDDRNRKQETREENKEPPKAMQRPPSINVREILAGEMRDMRRFLLSPVIKGITLQCTIRRDKSGFNRLFPKYYMSISEQLTFLLAGKKRAGNRTSNYMITMNQKDFNTKSTSFLGKVRSNFLGTEFMMYDNGLNPKRKGSNPTNVRTELGAVLYVRDS